MLRLKMEEVNKYECRFSKLSDLEEIVTIIKSMVDSSSYSDIKFNVDANTILTDKPYAIEFIATEEESLMIDALLSIII